MSRARDIGKLLVPMAAVAILVANGFSGTAWAKEGKASKINFLPSMELQLLFDDNIYVSGTAEASDVITHLMPGISAQYTMPDRGTVVAGVNGDFALYRDTDKNNWRSLGAFVSVDYEAPSGLIFNLTDNVTDTEDPYGSATNYGIGQQKKRRNNDLRLKAGVHMGNGFRVLGLFNSYVQDYDLAVDAAQDRTDYEYGVGVEKQLMPKTWGFVRYHHGKRDYTSVSQATNTDTNSSWNRINAGLTWDGSGKLAGAINFGHKWVDYEHYSDKSLLVAATSLTYMVTPYTVAGLNISREQWETSGNTQVAGTTAAETFAATRINATLSHRFMTKFVASCGLDYNTFDYESPSTREDTAVGVNVRLDYLVRNWLTASVKFSHKNLDSNVNVNDYTKNVTMFMLRAAY